METKEFLESFELQLLADEELRMAACQAVKHYLSSIEAKNRVDPSQIHAIQDTIRAGGLTALRQLAKNQKEKNTKENNKGFWTFIHSLISDTPELKYGNFSLYLFLQDQLQKREILKEPASKSGKIDQRNIKKQNRALIDQAVDSLLGIYFEHFNCHYLYRTRSEEES